MSNPICIGTDPYLESSIPVYDPREGLFWRQVWSGTEQGIAQQMALMNLDPATNRNEDQRWELDPSQRPRFTLTVTTPDYSDGRSSALNKFELVAKPIEKEIYEHPNFQTIETMYVRKIKQLIQDKDQLVEDGSVGYFNSTAQAVLYNLALKGSRKFLTHEWTFRYSIVTSRRFGTLVSLAKCEQLWTTAQLINPNTSGLIIPGNTLFALSSIPAPYGVAGDPPTITETVPLYDGTTGTATLYYKWAWLKVPPEFSQLPSGKMEIRQEWLLDLWPTYLYDAA